MKTVLVTGGSGFVGRHLIDGLEADPSVDQIVVLIRNPVAWSDLPWAKHYKKVKLLEGGLHDLTQWESSPLIRKLNGVFHLAAMVAHNRREREAVFRTNVDGSISMAKLAQRKACRMVYVSTSGTVGCFKDANKKADEHAKYVHDTVGRWPYYASKIKAEQQLLEMSKNGLDLVIIRPPIMLGPGDHRYRSTGLLLKFLNRKLPMVIRGGFPMVDVRDAAAAIQKAMNLAAPQNIYHLPGEQPSIDELFSMLEQISGVPAPTLHLPEKVVLAIARFDEWLGMKLRGEPLALVPDPVVIEMGTSYWGLSSLFAAEDLDFKPRSARTTLIDTVAWLREHPPSEDH
jgi:nucleoside-diphosphate-sugar epimerase